MTLRSAIATAVLAAVLAVVAVSSASAGARKPTTTRGYLDARQTAQAYIDAATHVRVKEAIALAEPGAAPSQDKKVINFWKLGIREAVVTSILVDEDSAVAMTQSVNSERVWQAPLVFRLVRIKGTWLVRDVDLVSDQSAKETFDQFREDHPKATESAESEKKN